MTIDINSLPYTELLSLRDQVANALVSKKNKEFKNAKKDWLNSEEAKKFLPRIESLRNKYAKLSSKVSKAKSVIIKVKMDVALKPYPFKEILNGVDCYSSELFNVNCIGTLLNPKDFGGLAEEIQVTIDSVMDEVCEDVIEILPLRNEINKFADELNDLILAFSKAQNLGLQPSDLEESEHKKKGKK